MSCQATPRRKVIDNGDMAGHDGTFCGDKNMTRYAAALTLYALCKALVK